MGDSINMNQRTGLIIMALRLVYSVLCAISIFSLTVCS